MSKLKIVYIVISVLAFGISHGLASGSPPSLEEIAAHYSGIRNFTADISQIKRAAYLIRPLETKVSLRVTQKEIIWEVKDPKPFKVTISNGELMFFDSDGKSARALSKPEYLKYENFISILKAVVTVDVGVLREKFELSMKGFVLTLDPRDKKSAFKRIRVEFREDLNPKMIEMALENEDLKLNLERFRVE
ncbi:MAG: outer membrane lipoprotein carrier protein LolA [Oligoflexales bacterium]|nr:outer membrane lipoprotein carrier protein LolA [Oligoflexales bacterium]